MEKESYNQLRERFQNFFLRYPELKWKKQVQVVNDSYPGTFNLSFNEPEHLKTFNNYINYNKKLFFGKIQPVIRYNDFLEKIVPNKDAYKYLGLFDMGGISLTYPDSKNMKEIVEKIIELGFNFLIKELGLDKNSLFIKLSAGGTVSDMTGGKYEFHKRIPPDTLSLKKWLKLGLKKEQIIFDSTRDTFLALSLFGHPSPWGYRAEILYNIKGDRKNLLDIGTIEYCPWKPVIKNEKIVDIVRNTGFSTLIVFGLERLLLAKNKYKHIMECDHILPLYKKIFSDTKIKDQHKSFVLIESIRVVYRILADVEDKKLGRHQKQKLRYYQKTISDLFNKLDIKKERIKTYLELYSKLNPFYPEFSNSAQKRPHF
ncbi:hypothetical protein KKF60_02400 [Patescibacteria group bacterium]|nr:hypothetical protein [Patescibacteria group bacterium]MBU4458719.1 hypothetical protein [Patescibacteria group bacterium]MCG2696080.1 hypothetical protein [Candidatus Portnoybacteria bacterium]